MQIIKFYWFDLDLDTMTLVLKHNLDIVKMYVYTKNEAPTFNGSKVTDSYKQTDSTKIITYPHTRMVKTSHHNDFSLVWYYSYKWW